MIKVSCYFILIKKKFIKRIECIKFVPNSLNLTNEFFDMQGILLLISIDIEINNHIRLK